MLSTFWLRLNLHFFASCLTKSCPVRACLHVFLGTSFDCKRQQDSDRNQWHGAMTSEDKRTRSGNKGSVSQEREREQHKVPMTIDSDQDAKCDSPERLAELNSKRTTER